nr:MAG TPA: hypothetical protein [Caudoviricetes sp.]
MKKHHSGIRNEYTENLRSQVTACSFLSVQMITNHLRFARFKIGHTPYELPSWVMTQPHTSSHIYGESLIYYIFI